MRWAYNQGQHTIFYCGTAGFLPIFGRIENVSMPFFDQLCIRKAIFQCRVFDSQVLSDPVPGFPPNLPQLACGYGG